MSRSGSRNDRRVEGPRQRPHWDSRASTRHPRGEGPYHRNEDARDICFRQCHGLLSPMAGDDIVVVESEERARMLSAGRKRKFEKDRLRQMVDERTETMEPSDDMPGPERVEMPFIVKADVQGTVQAVTDALKTLNSPQVH